MNKKSKFSGYMVKEERLLEVDQNTGYRIYFTNLFTFLVNDEEFQSFSEAKMYCSAMYSSY